MKVSRYRWSHDGMIYDDTAGEWVSQLTHEAVVAAYEQQVEQLVRTSSTTCMSLEARIAELEALIPVEVAP